MRLESCWRRIGKTIICNSGCDENERARESQGRAAGLGATYPASCNSANAPWGRAAKVIYTQIISVQLPEHSSMASLMGLRMRSVARLGSMRRLYSSAASAQYENLLVSMPQQGVGMGGYL